VTTIAGAFAAEALINKVDELPFSSLLGLTAGGLIYIIFLHLAPHASLTPHRRGYLMAGIGVIIALAALVFRELAGL
jgi:zinc transporter ZupT